MVMLALGVLTCLLAAASAFKGGTSVVEDSSDLVGLTSCAPTPRARGNPPSPRSERVCPI